MNILILYATIVGLVFLIMFILMLPLAFGIPLKELIMAKVTKSMIVLTLTPDKRLVANIAKSKSSIIETKRGSLHFLNVPDAVYSLWGIPTAIAYHRYGAILPFRNIIHATKMREKGFYNIGELKHTLNSYNVLLFGDTKTLGLYDQKAELEAAMEESDNESEEGMTFTIPIELENALLAEKKTHPLLESFRNAGHKIPLTAKITCTSETEWEISTHKAKYRIKREQVEDKEILKVYTGKFPKEILHEDLATVVRNITIIEEKVKSLEEVEIEDQGLIKVQDIFNFLDKNLSTDVIFSVIERATAEELRDMHDFKKTFIDLFPYILSLFFCVAVCYVIIMQVSDSGMGSSLLGGIPNLAP